MRLIWTRRIGIPESTDTASPLMDAHATREPSALKTGPNFSLASSVSLTASPLGIVFTENCPVDVRNHDPSRMNVTIVHPATAAPRATTTVVPNQAVRRVWRRTAHR
ncbi:MAG: hypothetical protein ABIQ52_01535 [Vicinamibacterales bacterium]